MTIPLPPLPDEKGCYSPDEARALIRQGQRLALEASIKALVNRPRESPTIVLAHMLKEIE